MIKEKQLEIPQNLIHIFNVKSLLNQKSLGHLIEKKRLFKTDQKSFQKVLITSRKTLVIES